LQINEAGSRDGEAEAKPRSSASLRRTRQSLQASSLAASLTQYRGTKEVRALRSVTTASKAFEEGRGARGAAKDVLLAEAKRRIVQAALTKAGLGTAGVAVQTLTSAREIAQALRAEIEQHSMRVYAFMLAIALIKDLVDIASLELFSGVDWIVDLFIWALLTFFLWGKGTWKVRFVNWMAGLFEFIPLIGFFPTWSLCVFYAFVQDRRKIQEKREAVQEIEDTIG
jgi:hypothetical protein